MPARHDPNLWIFELIYFVFVLVGASSFGPGDSFVASDRVSPKKKNLERAKRKKPKDNPGVLGKNRFGQTTVFSPILLLHQTE